MSKGKNRKPKAGEWSKYNIGYTPCQHDWQSGSLAEGWQKCSLCDAVRRFVPVKKEA